jgi:hypothetical protein
MRRNIRQAGLTPIRLYVAMTRGKERAKGRSVADQ